ncbi:dTDP-4-amino-4,6-dideoxygalactose transaminase [Actinoplanes sp. NBRC 103695]|uniref:dTDP-4-amino-4,6-dideoxygalactose transaminase n=1 Tax=Actinoplanes sp. NBRC 103695 TaxID=3032202 RepID=UPI0024A18F1A|nr:dTDP-4-amino-4,6-dideoxygalactose transaminase [Actinoplanes sp. NBRC 103695]GLZ00874.1 dTDP-4-amino-4,6-dideoxy-D-glucose transaminase [Actinoplanes sp. NBRC 103695]
MLIPFNRISLADRELEYLTTAAASGATSGDGPFTRRATHLLTGITSSPYALLTTSCTHALELSALLLELEPGDEVIMPSFTFVSTANAFVLRGAVPVFVDCRPDTLNLDERAVEAAITPRTKAIVVVHYAGVACAMDPITEIARRHGVPVIEDNAHGLGGSYRGRPLGSLGALATQSFHATKNVQCGEGGALLVNDAGLRERAEILREKGTDRSRFMRGQVDKYTWRDVGSSYLPSDVLAAGLTAQLEAFGEIQRRRHEIWSAYYEACDEFVRPTVPSDTEHAAHLFYVLATSNAERSRLIEHLASAGVQATFHYQPLHDSPAGLRFGRTGPGGCPVTEDVAERLVRLPLYPGLSDREAATVIAAVRSFRPVSVVAVR